MDLFGLSGNKEGWKLKGIKLGMNGNKFFSSSLIIWLKWKWRGKKIKIIIIFYYSNGDIKCKKKKKKKKKKLCMFSDDYNLNKLVWRIKPTGAIFEK